MESNLRWYVPSFHGDLLLEAKGPNETSLRAFGLTGPEKKGLETLQAKAIKSGWGTLDAFEVLISGDAEERTIVLAAPIDAVQKVLVKALKPGKKIIDAVRFADGRVEEKSSMALAEHRGAKAAVSVAAPTIGCPMPDFAEVDARATRVLEAFLDPKQVEDYRQHGAFVSVGASTGHKYLVANRTRKNAILRAGGRQLFDLDEQRALCVHDWSCPAPEEALALHLCVSLPGHEQRVRLLPETWS